jgi:antirestriction protein ArdC
MSGKFDLYQTVTDRVIDLMQTHGSNWVNPFNKKAGAYTPQNPTTGKAYQGMNVFLLATTPYPAPYWAGFGQWRDKGCTVKRGEKATLIVYWKILEKEKIVNGEAKIVKQPLLRYLNVFNVAQVDGDYAAKLLASQGAPMVPEAEINATADAFFKATGADIRFSNKPQAFYSMTGDYVHMPNRELFSATKTSSATESYYSTLAHELTHWSGAATRLKRDHAGRFGSNAYAFEELVAELGAAMLCAQLGISVEPRADHAHYLNNWLSVLRSDNAAILKAATLAKQAATFISKFSEPVAADDAASEAA